MNKPNSRSEIEQRIDLIRLSYEIVSNGESRDAVTDGLLAYIGDLLNEVDYWRAEYQRLQNSQDIYNTPGTQSNQVEDAVVSGENFTYECPHCNAGFEDDNYTGISWICIGCTVNEHGPATSIGFIHCSECGKVSPLYAGKEDAFINWCTEVQL